MAINVNGTDRDERHERPGEAASPASNLAPRSPDLNSSLLAPRSANLLSSLLDLVLPPLCHACREHVPNAGALHLCPDCLAAMAILTSPLCPTCGVPFATAGAADHPCGACLTDPPPFAAARAALLFSGPAVDLIHRLKYSQQVRLRRPLGLLTAELLAPFAAACRADLILPVPLHVKRLRQRGFNQAILIGELLARHWLLPLVRDNLRRVRWTEPQVGLAAAERAGNVRGAFAVAEPAGVKGKRLILVDDVYTTGSTVRECSRVLRQAGAAEVFAVTVARAPA
jgi:ComF family protein